MRHQAWFSVVPAPARLHPDKDLTNTGSAAWANVRRTALAGAGRLARRAALGTALVLFAVAGALFAVRSAYDDRVYPSIQTAGVQLGGLTHDEARSAIQRRADELAAGTVSFTFGDKTWAPTLEEIGAKVNVDATLTAAYEFGREPVAADRLESMARLVRADERVPLAIALDHRTLEGWFDQVDQQLGLPPRDASLTINGSSVGITSEAGGTIVDRGRARTVILGSLSNLQPVAELLPVVAKTPVVRSGDLGPARDQLAQALAKPIKVTFEDSSWSLAAADLGRFVTQQVDTTKRGADALSLGLDHNALAAWLEDRFGDQVNRDPVDAKVGWNGERVVSLEWSADGITLKPDELAEAVGASFFGDHANVAVPVIVTKPTVDSENLAALGITTFLAQGDSNYVGSDEARATNIAVGADLLNGTLVPPGGEFSFNHSIGVISKELGYVEGNAFEQGRLGTAVGGGICQVSTTVFRAALRAGVPITEWWPHDYRIGFYEQDGWEPGFDASILQPDEDPFSGGDFKFANPTHSWLLVESFVDGARVFVNIYGPDLGYDVRITDVEEGAKIPIKKDIEIVDHTLPEGTIKHTEAPQEGLEVYFIRDVYSRDGELLFSDPYYTTFHSRGNVYKVSPDMEGKSPAAGGGEE